MFTDSIEKLKHEFTDKYVIVDGSRPELKRFGTTVGQIKTVNMNGRALVQFLDYFNNSAWYDIDLDFLKVVDKPAEKPKEKAAKPAAEKAPAKPAGEAKAAAPAAPAGGKKQSVADILAAARGKAGSAPAAPAAKPATPAAPAGKKPSTADILAAARGKAAPAAKAPAAKAPPAPAPEPEPEAEPAPAAAPVKKPAKAGGAAPKSTADKIAYCRKVDAK